MDYKQKQQLARTGDASKEASALRLQAARKVAKMSQEELGAAGGVKKAAISNAEKGLAYPGRSVLLYLFREHRIDLNFMIDGEFRQLPADVQEALLAALSETSRNQEQKRG